MRCPGHGLFSLDSGKRILWQASNKNAKLPIKFFGNPFKAYGTVQLECVHGGHKRIHKPSEVQYTLNIVLSTFLTI